MYQNLNILGEFLVSASCKFVRIRREGQMLITSAAVLKLNYRSSWLHNNPYYLSLDHDSVVIWIGWSTRSTSTLTLFSLLLCESPLGIYDDISTSTLPHTQVSYFIAIHRLLSNIWSLIRVLRWNKYNLLYKLLVQYFNFHDLSLRWWLFVYLYSFNDLLFNIYSNLYLKSYSNSVVYTMIKKVIEWWKYQ